MWQHFRKKEGAGRPAPRSGIKGYLYLIYTYYWQMLFLNICFCLACIPVVTIPIALTALNRVYIKLCRDGVVLFWQEFLSECKSSWKKSLRAGLLYGVLLFVCYYLLSLSNGGMDLWGMFTGIVGLVLFILAVVTGAYTFILIAVQELPLKVLLKNAGNLAVLCPGQSAVILVLVVAFFAVAIFHFAVFHLLDGSFSAAEIRLETVTVRLKVNCEQSEQAPCPAGKSMLNYVCSSEMCTAGISAKLE